MLSSGYVKLLIECLSTSSWKLVTLNTVCRGSSGIF